VRRHWHVTVWSESPGATGEDVRLEHVRARRKADALRSLRPTLGEFRKSGCRVEPDEDGQMWVVTPQDGPPLEVFIWSCRDPACLADFAADDAAKVEIAAGDKWPPLKDKAK